MGLQGLQRVAITIILILGILVGWFANSFIGGVQSVVAGVARPQGATPAVDSQPIKVGNSVIWSP